MDRKPSQGASPGGPVVSSKKKRRLAALAEAYTNTTGATAASATASIRNAASTGEQQARGQTSRLSSDRVPRSAPEAGLNEELQEFPYNPLPHHALHTSIRKLLPSSGSSTSRNAPNTDGPDSGMESFLTNILESGSSRLGSDASRSIITSRIADKTLLLDNPSQQPNAGAALRRRAGPAATTKLMSGRERKQLLGGPKEVLAKVKYQDLVLLNQRWLQYVEGLLVPPTGAEGRLLLAEFTGCELLVKHCRQRSLVGLQGIVAIATSSCFHVITPEGQHRVLPKEGCVVEVLLPGQSSVTIVGTNLKRISAKKEPLPMPFAL